MKHPKFGAFFIKKELLEQISNYFRFPKPNFKNDPENSDKHCN